MYLLLLLHVYALIIKYTHMYALTNICKQHITEVINDYLKMMASLAYRIVMYMDEDSRNL